MTIRYTHEENTKGILWGADRNIWISYRDACDLPHPNNFTSKTYDAWLKKRNEQKKLEPEPPTFKGPKAKVMSIHPRPKGSLLG